MDSEGDAGLSIDSEEEEEEELDDDTSHEVAAVLGGGLGSDVAVGGSRGGSRTTTPTVVAGGLVESGVEIVAANKVGIPQYHLLLLNNSPRDVMLPSSSANKAAAAVFTRGFQPPATARG
jgi:hypothetical protein